MNKYILVVVSVLLAGCLGAPMEKIANTNCLHTRWEIVEVTKKGFLLQECKYYNYLGFVCSDGLNAFYPVDTTKEPWNNFGEGMRISSTGTDTCLVKDGTYKYVNSFGRERTILKLNGDDLYITNPEYIKWQENHKK